MKILTEATPLALWQQALQEAQTDSQILLKPDVEAYLVFMLMRHLNDRDLVRVMASRFLEGLRYAPKERSIALQKVGDQCLLISGLFPAFAEKRLVKVRYYIELGQVCYEVISRKNNDIFSILSKQFVTLMDVLQSFRPCPQTALPAELYQLWEQGQNPPKSAKK